MKDKVFVLGYAEQHMRNHFYGETGGSWIHIMSDVAIQGHSQFPCNGIPSLLSLSKVHAIILINNLIIKYDSYELNNGFQDGVSLLGCKRSKEIINCFGKALNLENRISTLLYDKSLFTTVDSSENLSNRYGSFSYFCNTIRKIIIVDSTKHHRKSQIPS